MIYRAVFPFSCAVLLVLSACNGVPTEDSHQQEQSSTQQSAPGPQGPQEVCAALTEVGIATEGWKQNPGGTPGYYCQSDYVWVGPEHSTLPGIRNLVVYSVESVATDPNAIERIILEGRYYRVLNKDRLKKKVTAATRTLFSSLGAEVPTEVLDAVAAENAFEVSQPFGRVTVSKDCGPELPGNNRQCSITVEVQPGTQQ